MDRKKITKSGSLRNVTCVCRKVLHAFLLTVLVISMLPSMANAKSRKKEQPAEEVVQTPAVEPLITQPAPALKQRKISLSFKEMGALLPLQIRGVEGAATLPFSIRSDEVVVGAKLVFDYNYSPSLIPELSHLKILLNDEVVSVIPLPREKAQSNNREIELDSRLFADYNKLRFSLIGHYTYRCEDPMHSSLWLNISNAGRLELTMSPLALANDLKYLPVPFFDRRDSAALKLPFVFSGTPTFGTMKAAGIVASWFGGLASYRGARFPAMQNALPNGNAVVFIQGTEKVAGMQAEPGASVAIVPHPGNPGAKLMIVSGKNEEEMLRAARAIVLYNATLSGQRVSVTADQEPAPRKAYDAPAWVPVDRPVRFAELAKLEDLDVRGYFPDVVRLNFRVSPDLFTWRSNGVPVDLKYRFTQLPYSKNASLNINVNNKFLQALALNEPGKLTKAADGLVLGGRSGNLSIRNENLHIPAFQVGGRNQLQLHYYFDVVKEGDCKDTIPDNLQAAIDPESSIDFSQFPHYSALPNLAYFSNIGFPFTRMADLSQTAVVMPERPNSDELASYLMLMGRMGEATGYPVLRHTIIPASGIEQAADNDLLVIGSAQNQVLMTKWADHMPLMQIDGVRKVREPDFLRRFVSRWAEQDLQQTPGPKGSLSMKAVGDLTTMMAFESPLKSNRSVVFLYADKSADLAKITEALNDPERIASVQGDFVVFDDKSINHAKVASTYYVGNLPWTTHLHWFFSQHPLLAVLLGLLMSIILAVIMYRKLRKVAAKRLEKSF